MDKYLDGIIPFGLSKTSEIKFRRTAAYDDELANIREVLEIWLIGLKRKETS